MAIRSEAKVSIQVFFSVLLFFSLAERKEKKKIKKIKKKILWNVQRLVVEYNLTIIPH
jgi:hypothetical protein